MDRPTTEALVPGMYLQARRPDGEWGPPREIESIYARGYSQKDGAAYVLGYTEFGPSSRISFSIREGEDWYRLAAPDEMIDPEDVPFARADLACYEARIKQYEEVLEFQPRLTAEQTAKLHEMLDEAKLGAWLLRFSLGEAAK